MAEKLKIPESLIQIIRNMYIENKGQIHIQGQEETRFRANIGVKQGDEISPKLFCIFFDQVYPYLLEYFELHNLLPTTRFFLEIATL